jgi:phosphoglycolate phosphatase-like HAD superfamily hydrolase
MGDSFFRGPCSFIYLRAFRLDFSPLAKCLCLWVAVLEHGVLLFALERLPKFQWSLFCKNKFNGKIIMKEIYQTYIFDCDGVLLDSNPVKGEAFYRAALPYGENVASAIREYHMANGGISRFRKFRYVFEVLLGRTEYEADYDAMVIDFSRFSREGLMACSPVAGVRKYLESLPAKAQKFVISGAEEEELRWCLEHHGLASFFDGIFGSPRSKPEVLQGLKESGALVFPAIYFGDSRYDFLSSTSEGCDFKFVSGYTDFTSWRAFVAENGIESIQDFTDLLV